MATQAIKLVERLKNTHGHEASLQQTVHIGSRFVRENSQLPRLHTVSQHSLKFTPAPDSRLPRSTITKLPNECTATIKVSLVAGKLSVFLSLYIM